MISLNKLTQMHHSLRATHQVSLKLDIRKTTTDDQQKWDNATGNRKWRHQLPINHIKLS